MAKGRIPRSRTEGGFTLIEILIVLAIVGLITGSAVRGFRSLAKSDLRAAANHLSGAARYLFDRASTTGKYHRLVIDIDQGKYWAEVSDDRFYVPRERETDATREKDLKDKEEEKEAQERKNEQAEQSGFDLSTIQAEDFRPKRPRFGAFKEMALKPVTLKRAKIVGVFTPRLLDPLTEGQAYLYFFPMGQTEPAYIHLTDQAGEHSYSLVVHPLTGRVKVYDRFVEPPLDDRFDDEGNRVER